MSEKRYDLPRLRDIEARLERATGPDRELDGAIFYASGVLPTMTTPPLTALVEALRKAVGQSPDSDPGRAYEACDIEEKLLWDVLSPLRAALSAFEAEPQGWRDIAGAPQDRTRIDLWVRNAAGEGLRIANCYGWRGEWLTDEGRYLAPRYTPTHWQPLPLPPETPHE